VVAVICLLNPGKKFIFCSIENPFLLQIYYIFEDIN